MALYLSSVQPCLVSSLYHKQIFLDIRPERLRLGTQTELEFSHFISPTIGRLRHFTPPKLASINGISVQDNLDDSSKHHGEANLEFRDRLRRWIGLFRSFLPGGSWWSFCDDAEVVLTAKPVTVLRALHRMWDLIAEDRWVIFGAFTALILTALSEISVPHFLTASIFSAQNGEVMVFYRNVRLLILLCFTKGICSGLRGCFFGIANTILVKRIRETLYSTLLFQDVSFFDVETVGDLTSRLGADCQQVSRVIGNDLNLILRNLLQGMGALIYLLVISWPLGLYTLATCSTLSTIMLLYGQ